MTTSLTPGSHADITFPNALIQQVSPDSSWILAALPDIGQGVYEGWIPTDSRVTIKLIAPASWPAQDGDLWIVPGASSPAWIVTGSDGRLYFVVADNIRAAYQGVLTSPITTDEALAQFGNALTLLYRKP